VSDEGLTIMTTDYRTKIRSQIAPMHPTPTYLTEWAGRQTSEQIYENLAVYASNIMKLYGVLPHEIPDCIQAGFIALLEQLAREPYFLACMTRRQAVYFILARCKISTLRYREQQYDSFEELVSDDRHDTADEHAITGWEFHREERWAAWATDVDLRLDVERVMTKLAEKYIDSPKHLIALYQVTTSVKRCDAAQLAGVTHWNWLKTYVEPVLKDVRYEFAQVFLEHHCYEPLDFNPAKRPMQHIQKRPTWQAVAYA